MESSSCLAFARRWSAWFASAISMLALASGCGFESHEPDAAQTIVEYDAIPPDASRPDGWVCPLPNRCGDDCCEATEACRDGICCGADRTCPDTCCGEGDTCQAGECRQFCGLGMAPPCGETGAEACCSETDVCYREACTTPGESCDDVYDCGMNWYCEPTLDACLPLPPNITCELPAPPAGEFAPTLQWEWTGSSVVPDHNQVMMKPAVADITGDGIPDVIFHTFKYTPAPTTEHPEWLGDDSWRKDGVMRAVRGDSGAEIFSVDNVNWRTSGGSSITVADIDRDGFPELITCGEKVITDSSTGANTSSLMVFEHTGQPKWKTADSRVACAYAAPSVGDLDKDGTPEILVHYTVVNANGTVRFQAGTTPANPYGGASKFSTLADVDADGSLEIVGGNRVYETDGTQKWSRANDGWGDGAMAVADLDMDGDPDIVTVDNSNHRVMAFDARTGANLWPASQNINQNPDHLTATGGGPPTVADFDGDGKPEVGAAGGYDYVVFEGENGALKWAKATNDDSSRQTGSSVFDFEGDGIAEVVYNDETTLHIYRGTDGADLYSACNSSGTLFEYPVIVDVDDDDRAEIVVARNDYISYSACPDGSTPSVHGVAVFRDALDNWVRTRRIWNQHTYHVTNISESGEVPINETPNWTVPGLNNFRQNVQPWGVHVAPDLVVESIGTSRAECTDRIHVEARIKNQGDAGARPGIPVAFYLVEAGGASILGVVQTAEPILPGQTIIVSMDYPVPADGINVVYTFTVAVDDDGTGAAPGEGAGNARECVESNNVGPEATGDCPIIP